MSTPKFRKLVPAQGGYSFFSLKAFFVLLTLFNSKSYFLRGCYYFPQSHSFSKSHSLFLLSELGNQLCLKRFCYFQVFFEVSPTRVSFFALGGKNVACRFFSRWVVPMLLVVFCFSRRVIRMFLVFFFPTGGEGGPNVACRFFFFLPGGAPKNLACRCSFLPEGWAR